MMKVVSDDNWNYKMCQIKSNQIKSSQIITTNKPTSSVLQIGCPSRHPTNSVKALEGKYHIPWTCLPQAHLGSSSFVSNQ